MPDGRCTDAHETLAFNVINGNQNVSSKHHFWVKDQLFKKRKKIDISKEAKKISNFYYEEQQIVNRLSSLLNYHSCDNIVEKLKTGNNFNLLFYNVG